MKALLIALGILLAGTAHGETWRFALIGDTPYNSHERRELPQMLQEIAREQPRFIVHVGDFKNSNAPCSDELFADRHALFDASPLPFIYLPGDNEWTDCRRTIAGRYESTERLEKLRQLFFADSFSLGANRLPLARQAGYPEHQRWQLGPVVFVSLNVPGPNNSFGNSAAPSAEFLLRNRQVLDWLKEGFAKARDERSAGIVITMQGNPGFAHFAAGLAHSGYRELLETLRRETLAFPGQVLLVHGDTHWQRIDKPLRRSDNGRPIANFTRLETFGYPFMGWVTAIIDSDTPALFRFEVHAYPEKTR